MQAQAIYNDFNSLANLRGAARRDADASLEEVAAQFESLFVQMMLKSMRDATPEGGLFDSNQMDSYRQMHDQQLSLDLSARGGIGLAKVLVEQLQSSRGAIDNTDKTDKTDRADASNMPGQSPFLLSPSAPTGVAGELAPYRAAPSPGFRTGNPGGFVTPARSAQAPDAAARNAWAPSSPADFATQLRPAAERAATALGVDAGVLLAQAALETGWGKYVSADGRGNSSNNFFNIKAGADWGGPAVTVQTLEYRDGVAVRESARFRAYNSPAESFADYAQLIQGSPRYSAALERAADGEQYLRELQRAGYATDPHYADKILTILDGAGLSGPVATLKKPANLPLSG